VAKIPEGPPWTYEIKLDGYRILAVSSADKVTLYSHRGNDLTRRYSVVANDLSYLPNGTVVDGD
jgi:ATP-dependent DNA ligase